MYTVNDLSKRFGDTLLFEHVSFSINPGDRIGLVGPNGTGKSTLLRILAGENHPDSGSIAPGPGVRVGYLRQGFTDVPDGTLADLLDIPTGGLFEAQRDLIEATAAFSDSADPEAVAGRFQQATDTFDALGGYAAVDRVEALLDRFGLGGLAPDRLLDTLSGGQKTRAGLAGLLATAPDLLLLDEPTNHLDTDALRWLANVLAGYPGAVLIVSHDRGFLDQLATRILAIDPLTRTVDDYTGTYSTYVASKHQEEEDAEAAWKRQQVQIERMTRDIRAAEGKARAIEASTIDYAVRKKAAKIARPAVVRKRKLERLLESEEAASKPVRRWSMALDLSGDPDGARDVASLDRVGISLGGTPVLQDIDLLVRRGDRIALVGPNGSGKTTLMRIIAGDLLPDYGTLRLGPGVRAGYLAQEQHTLNADLTVLEQARSIAPGSESDLRTFLHKFLFGGDMALRRVGDLSYGERARLMLALLALKETTLLLLDEPLNHLDITSREEFEHALARFEGTTIMVSHDQYMIDRFATRVLALRDGRLHDLANQIAEPNQR